MTGVSWHQGCPVGFGRLRLLRVTHWGFDGEVHSGRLVVHRNSAQPLLQTMRELFELRFPIRRMRLVDAYGPMTTAAWRPTTPPSSTAASWPAPAAGPNTPTATPKDYQHFSAEGG
jgi:hypothetical protein